MSRFEFLPEQLDQIGELAFVRLIDVGAATRILGGLAMLDTMDAGVDFFHGSVETRSTEELDGFNYRPERGEWNIPLRLDNAVEGRQQG